MHALLCLLLRARGGGGTVLKEEKDSPMIGCIDLLADFLWAILSTYSLGTFKVWQSPLLKNVVGHGEREERGDLLSEAMGRELCFLHTTTATFPFFFFVLSRGDNEKKELD